MEGAPTTVVAIGENQTLTAGTQAVFKFGSSSPNQDDFKFTPTGSAAGDSLTVTPVPVAAWTGTAPNFPTLACVPYYDYSTNAASSTCVEIEMDCSGTDSCNFAFTTQLDYGVYGPGVPTGNLIGGPHLLIQHDVPCPTTGFDHDILSAYTGATRVLLLHPILRP